uniref:Uncharacterized protein n=1 Tax=Arundo donax TaxID=35708 RepID=A0A0A9GHS1_ARUDO
MNSIRLLKIDPLCSVSIYCLVFLSFDYFIALRLH